MDFGEDLSLKSRRLEGYRHVPAAPSMTAFCGTHLAIGWARSRHVKKEAMDFYLSPFSCLFSMHLITSPTETLTNERRWKFEFHHLTGANVLLLVVSIQTKAISPITPIYHLILWSFVGGITPASWDRDRDRQTDIRTRTERRNSFLKDKEGGIDIERDMWMR